MYVQRFWDIDDRRLRAEQVGDKDELLLQDRRYVRLCEDEFELVRLGWIDAEIWAVWHASIRVALEHSRALVDAEPIDLLLARRCRGAFEHEPTACPAVIGPLESTRASKHRYRLRRNRRRVAPQLRSN